MVTVFDDRACELGEGPIWHPERQQLMWFDILRGRLLSRTQEAALAWSLGEMASAAGWIDRDRLLIASETALSVFDLSTGEREVLAPFLADRPDLRSNDGRADPWGGFWIGGMGKRAEAEAGGIWRYFRGELRLMFAPVTIPNAISFTPDGSYAHFADSDTRKVWRVALAAKDGWPAGDPTVFLDLSGMSGTPDGAVFDEAGNFWLAEWGAARVACYDRNGTFLRSLDVPGKHASCPAFGGPGFDRLYVTSARENLSSEALLAEPLNGCTFTAEAGAKGLPEPRVIL